MITVETNTVLSSAHYTFQCLIRFSPKISDETSKRERVINQNKPTWAKLKDIDKVMIEDHTVRASDLTNVISCKGVSVSTTYHLLHASTTSC